MDSATVVHAQVLTPEQLEAIRRFDTCTIANAIESFGVRLRNEGFTRPGLRSMCGPDDRVIGYAATFRVKSSDPPVTGGRFVDRTDWWGEMERLPRPRIAVFESINGSAGTGACVGEVHAAILKAFGCNGVVTDGSVRDLPGIRKLGFPTFAVSASVSHSFMHIVEFGGPIAVLGLSVQEGDLLYADCHGVISIPLEIAAELPEVAERMHRRDRQIVELCQAADFSADRLLEAIREEDPAA